MNNIFNFFSMNKPNIKENGQILSSDTKQSILEEIKIRWKMRIIKMVIKL